MRVRLIIAATFLGFASIFLSFIVTAQQTSPKSSKLKVSNSNQSKNEAVIQHKLGSAVITGKNARPLAQAIDAVKEEYNWAIDYEDPPYISELANTSDPNWKAAYPGDNSRPNSLVPAGGVFQAEYEENSSLLSTPNGKRKILEKIVSDYNLSGNPGKFSVKQTGDQRFAIVGVSVKDQNGRDKDIIPVLDTPITIPTEQRSSGKTLDLILNEVSRKTGNKITRFSFNENSRPTITVGGENVPARVLLMQVIPNHQWRLVYLPDSRDFVFSISAIGRVDRDTFGRKRWVRPK